MSKQLGLRSSSSSSTGRTDVLRVGPVGGVVGAMQTLWAMEGAHAASVADEGGARGRSCRWRV